MGKWNFNSINNLSIIDEKNKVMMAIDRTHGGGWSTKWTICPMDYEFNILFWKRQLYKEFLSNEENELDAILINMIYELCCVKGVVSIKDGKDITLDDIRELDIKLEYVNDGDGVAIGNTWIANVDGSVWEDHIWEEVCDVGISGRMLMIMDDFGTVISEPHKRYKAKRKEYKK
jgi:hypothetical protein